jgi:hypothetical protein
MQTPPPTDATEIPDLGEDIMLPPLPRDVEFDGPSPPRGIAIIINSHTHAELTRIPPLELQCADMYADLRLHDALAGPPAVGMSVATERRPLMGIARVVESHSVRPCHPNCPDPALCERTDVFALLPRGGRRDSD